MVLTSSGQVSSRTEPSESHPRLPRGLSPPPVFAVPSGLPVVARWGWSALSGTSVPIDGTWITPKSASFSGNINTMGISKCCKSAQFFFFPLWKSLLLDICHHSPASSSVGLNVKCHQHPWRLSDINEHRAASPGIRHTWAQRAPLPACPMLRARGGGSRLAFPVSSWGWG